MNVKYFTVEEANDLLPEIRPLMRRLLERRARVSRMAHRMGPRLRDLRSNVGGTVASEMTLDFEAINQLVHKIQSYGCILKDVNAGLLDFLSKRDGRDVYLCWRYGEPEVEFYHELHTGFAGREAIEENS